MSQIKHYTTTLDNDNQPQHISNLEDGAVVYAKNTTTGASRLYIKEQVNSETPYLTNIGESLDEINIQSIRKTTYVGTDDYAPQPCFSVYTSGAQDTAESTVHMSVASDETVAGPHEKVYKASHTLFADLERNDASVTLLAGYQSGSGTTESSVKIEPEEINLSGNTHINGNVIIPHGSSLTLDTINAVSNTEISINGTPISLYGELNINETTQQGTKTNFSVDTSGNVSAAGNVVVGSNQSSSSIRVFGGVSVGSRVSIGDGVAPAITYLGTSTLASGMHVWRNASSDNAAYGVSIVGATNASSDDVYPQICIYGGTSINECKIHLDGEYGDITAEGTISGHAVKGTQLKIGNTFYTATFVNGVLTFTAI